MSLSDESAANATNGKHPPTPFNIDGEPITYDGNPAHVEGILHELSEWTARTGHYVTLLENNAVLLPDGKMAVDSIAAVLFVSGEKDDGGKYSFHTPCPATSERIKKFDAEASRTSSATFTAPSKMPDEHAGSFIPSKFQVQAEDLRFLNSLSQIIADSDLRSDLIKRSGRSGRAFLTEFRKEGAKATAGDKTLVVTNLESYALSGHVGALTLTTTRPTRPRSSRRRWRAAARGPRPSARNSTTTSRTAPGRSSSTRTCRAAAACTSSCGSSR